MIQTVTVLYSDTDGRPFLFGAGGCFWGVELAFQRVPGVTKTSVGYTAGHDKAPTYNSVCSGQTRHAEAVQVREIKPWETKFGLGKQRLELYM